MLKGLIDTHAHLSDLEDRAGVVMRARDVGVEAVVSVGANLATSRATMEWAEAYPKYVHPALGIHPTEWANDDIPTTLKYIEGKMADIVAVGEIGLDYWDAGARKDKGVREKQRQIYIDLLKMAKEHSKPVSIHGRGSWRDAFDLALLHGPDWAVFHWYSGPLDILAEILDHGYYISATPSAEYSRDHRAALANAPLERIMIETDSPVYLRNRGRPSEPADLTITVNALARLKDTTEEDIAFVTARNSKLFFRIP